MRRLGTVLMTVGLVLAMGATAYAGDMAITSFDSLPATFDAGKTYTLTYSVLQHGVTPVDGDSSLIFTRVDDGEQAVFEGEPTGEPGRYRVDVTIPVEGEWEWQVTQGPFAPQQMEPITVEPGATTAPSPTPALPMVVATVLLLAVLVAAWFIVRRSVEQRANPVRATAQTN